MSKHITDAEVEIEIRKIYDSEAYRLGSAEIRYRRKRRELLYTLRGYYKHGLELMKQGYTLENYRGKVNESLRPD